MNEPYTLIIGLLLLGGLLAGLVASWVNIPRVAAYVLAGVLFTPDLLGGYLHFNIGAWTEPFTTMALGIIAFLIGGSITICHHCLPLWHWASHPGLSSVPREDDCSLRLSTWPDLCSHKKFSCLGKTAQLKLFYS